MASVAAMVLTKPKTLEQREFAHLAIGTDDAMLRIEACGICGSRWKGKGLWATVSTRAPFHMEGGKGTLSKVVKFQLRPDPLAR